MEEMNRVRAEINVLFDIRKLKQSLRVKFKDCQFHERNDKLWIIGNEDKVDEIIKYIRDKESRTLHHSVVELMNYEVLNKVKKTKIS